MSGRKKHPKTITFVDDDGTEKTYEIIDDAEGKCPKCFSKEIKQVEKRTMFEHRSKVS